VEAHDLGKTVVAEDVAGVREGLLSLLNTPNLRAAVCARSAQVARQFEWERVAQPIVEFC
jgi:hypothetical protein